MIIYFLMLIILSNLILKENKLNKIIVKKNKNNKMLKTTHFKKLLIISASKYIFQ